VEKAQNEVDKLRQEYPLETPEQLAHRIMVDTALKAGGIGLLTNFVPPLALTLFAVDLAAVTALQAEMVYRIAAAYGFSLKDPARRGEAPGNFRFVCGRFWSTEGWARLCGTPSCSGCCGWSIE
jgi:hypothetical protein